MKQTPRRPARAAGKRPTARPAVRTRLARACLDVPGVVIVALDRDGRVLEASRSACALLGYEGPGLIGQDWFDTCLPAESRAAARTAFRKTISGKRRADDYREYPVKTRAGEQRMIAWQSSLLTDRRGRVTGTVSSGTEVTALRRAEQELATYRRQLEELAANRTRELRRLQEQLLRRERLAAVGEIAGSIAHELRNPLGAIRNAVYFLNIVLQRDLKEKAGRHLDIINSEIDRSDRIIAALLDYARGRPCNPAPTDLKEIIDDALGIAHLPASVAVRSQLDGLPRVNVDDAQATQIFANLLTNAGQAMAGHGAISIDARRADGYVEVTVSDNGPGIKPEVIERIFEPLFSTKTFGVGLGLAVCRSFVESNNGTIEVESEPGKGARFTVRLPVAAG